MPGIGDLLLSDALLKIESGNRHSPCTAMKETRPTLRLLTLFETCPILKKLHSPVRTSTKCTVLSELFTSSPKLYSASTVFLALFKTCLDFHQFSPVLFYLSVLPHSWQELNLSPALPSPSLPQHSHSPFTRTCQPFTSVSQYLFCLNILPHSWRDCLC